MIIFQEHPQTGYAMRTWDNARLSDLTIAFATDFNTPGELLTRKAAYGKYYAVSITDLLEDINKPVAGLLKEMHRRNAVTLNIAGNGIYTLQKLCDQFFINRLLLNFFEIIKLNYPYKIVTRNGGQSGVDLAGGIVSETLGWETTVLAPKHWMFRDINGRDIIGHEALFLKRFGEKYDATDIL